MGHLTPENVLWSTYPASLKLHWHVAGPAAATDCITSYRRSLLTMSQAAASALIVRTATVENINCHRGDVVIQLKLSTAVAMSVSMTVTRLCYISNGHQFTKNVLRILLVSTFCVSSINYYTVCSYRQTTDRQQMDLRTAIAKI